LVRYWPFSTFWPFTLLPLRMTLVNRMPVWLRGENERTQDRIEINSKVVLESRSFVAPAGIRRERAPAPHDASSSSNFLASFRSRVSNPSVNQAYKREDRKPHSVGDPGPTRQTKP
jgi:hypothetical protein